MLLYLIFYVNFSFISINKTVFNSFNYVMIGPMLFWPCWFALLGQKQLKPFSFSFLGVYFSSFYREKFQISQDERASALENHPFRTDSMLRKQSSALGNILSTSSVSQISVRTLWGCTLHTFLKHHSPYAACDSLKLLVCDKNSYRLHYRLFIVLIQMTKIASYALYFISFTC